MRKGKKSCNRESSGLGTSHLYKESPDFYIKVEKITKEQKLYSRTFSCNQASQGKKSVFFQKKGKKRNQISSP